jgi:hypothetical protein
MMALGQAKKKCVPKVELKELLFSCYVRTTQEFLQLHLCIVLNCAVTNPIVDRNASFFGFVLDPKFGGIFGGTRDKGGLRRLVVPTLKVWSA